MALTPAQKARRHYDRVIRPRRAATRKARANAWQREIFEMDACWLAGHFEGEGTVSLSKGGTLAFAIRPVASISSTDRQVIQTFCDRWPAALSGPRIPAPNAKPVYTWRISGSLKVKRFLTTLWPHFRTTRVIAKAQIVLEFCERMLAEEYNREGDKSWKLPMLIAVQRLNHRGTTPFLPME